MKFKNVPNLKLKSADIFSLLEALDLATGNVDGN